MTYLWTMEILSVNSIHGYKPRPDFVFRLYDGGEVQYTGRYYVGVVGEETWTISTGKLDQVKLLVDYLKRRNHKSYLKRIQTPIYSVVTGDGLKLQFEIDESDAVSDDIIRQILDITGVGQRVYADLDLYLVMSKARNRSRELGIVRARDSDYAMEMFLNQRSSKKYRNSSDYWAFRIGRQHPDTLHNPLIYFTYTNYHIQENTRTLYLNLGEDLIHSPYNVYIFVSFGKRYNDPTASYFLVLARNGDDAREILQHQFPHFMEHDYQLVDTESSYQPIPMFTRHIPIAIR